MRYKRVAAKGLANHLKQDKLRTITTKNLKYGKNIAFLQSNMKYADFCT